MSLFATDQKLWFRHTPELLRQILQRRAPEQPALAARLSRRDWACLAGLLAMMTALALWWNLPAKVAFNGDSAAYMTAAKSLAEGRGFRLVTYQGDPVVGYFQPLYPLYLSLFWRLGSSFPENTPWLVFGMVLLGLAHTTLLFLFLRRSAVPLWFTGLAVGLWAVSPSWQSVLYAGLSDVLFSTLGLAVALLWVGPGLLSEGRRWWLTGIGLAAMMLTREAARPFVAGLVVVLLLSHWRRRASVWLALFGPVLTAVLFERWLTHGSTSRMDAFFWRVNELGGAAGYAQGCLQVFFSYMGGLPFLEDLAPRTALFPAHWAGAGPWGTPALALVLLLVLGGQALAVWGLVRRGTGLDWALGFMVLCYLLQLVLWPFGDPRFLWPILPAFLLWFWRGLEALPWHGWSRRLVWATALLFCLANIPLNLSGMPEKRETLLRRPWSDDLVELSTWINQNIPRDAKLAISWTEPVLHFHAYTGHLFLEDGFTASIPFPPPVSAVAQGQLRPDYVIVQNTGWGHWDRIRQLGQEYPGLFQQVAGTRHNRYGLFKIDPKQFEHYQRDYTGWPPAKKGQPGRSFATAR